MSAARAAERQGPLAELKREAERLARGSSGGAGVGGGSGNGSGGAAALLPVRQTVVPRAEDPRAGGGDAPPAALLDRSRGGGKTP